MLGFTLVILGSLALAAQNVLIRILFVESPVLGLFSWGGFLDASPANSMLILQMRAVLILPVMLLLSPRLHAATWTDLQTLVKRPQRPLLVRVLASSVSLFVALALLFVALAQIPAGIATVLFFIHPAITVLLSWKLFGERPTALRIGVVATVLLGSLLVAPNFAAAEGHNVLLGVSAALGAGVGYSLQGILAQTCFRELHPVSFTLVTFVVMVVLSSLLLMTIPIDISPEVWTILWLASFVAAVLTLTGQLFYNFGIHLASAAVVSIIAISNPTFTALLGWWVIHEALQGRQILGVLMVILGVMALSQEKRAAVEAE
jgi:drug/metabolite transporter (DMT)-like permease